MIEQNVKIEPSLAIAAYRSLYRTRRVEEEIGRVYPTDKVKSPIHLSIGQEAISVAVCQALRPDDVVFGTYRCHAMYLAKGGDLPKMIAELYGKGTGCAKGKAGSMHLIDVAAGVMGGSAVVGTTIPQAVGYALALKMQRKSSLVVCFLGDGAVEEGAFHESLSFAALRRLPILFVCENNYYAIHSRQDARQPRADICEMVQGYGIPASRFEKMDYLELYEHSVQVTEAIRVGDSGPQFMECFCYRWLEHVGPNKDFHFGYRSQSEAQTWMDEDPVKRVAELLDPRTRQKVETEVEGEIRDAFTFAEQSPVPEDRELYTDLFKDS